MTEMGLNQVVEEIPDRYFVSSGMTGKKDPGSSSPLCHPGSFAETIRDLLGIPPLLISHLEGVRLFRRSRLGGRDE